MILGIEGNLFEHFARRYGTACFQDVDKIKRVRNMLTKFIAGHGGYRKIVHKIIQHALEFHQKWHEMIESDDLHLSCSIHSVIILALHLCQKYNIKDKNGIVRELLTVSYKCEKGFDRFTCLLDPLIFAFEVDPILYPFGRHPKLGGVLTKQHLVVLEYFLKASREIQFPVVFTDFDWNREEAHLSTRTEEVGMAEMPVSTCRGSCPMLLACHSTSPEAVLMLLRHGADPLRPGQAQHVIGMQFQQPIYVLVTKLNASIFWRTHNQHLDPFMRSEFMEKQEQCDRQLEQCLRYMCRAVVRMPVVCDSNPSERPRNSDRRDPMTFRLHPTFKDLLPPTRTHLAPELKHLCRFVIRRSLKHNMQLPTGIHILPLPKYLKEYIDLRYD